MSDFVYNPDADEIYELVPNPVAAYTKEEWLAILDHLRRERDAVQKELDSYPQPPKDWPEQAQALWWTIHEEHLNRLRQRLAELDAELQRREGVV